MRALRDLARERGLWILSDEVYAHFTYGNRIAPSFLQICTEDDRLIVTNTFSKNWAMTGWRIGWLQAPKALASAVERLIQYNSSGTAVFMQRASIEALDHGEEFVASQVARARANRDLVAGVLAGLPGVILVRLTLRPVDEMIKTIKQTTAENLKLKIP